MAKGLGTPDHHTSPVERPMFKLCGSCMGKNFLSDVHVFTVIYLGRSTSQRSPSQTQRSSSFIQPNAGHYINRMDNSFQVLLFFFVLFRFVLFCFFLIFSLICINFLIFNTWVKLAFPLLDFWLAISNYWGSMVA